MRVRHALRIDRFGPNTVGRDLVVGDVHGHFTRLLGALRAIRFDESVDRLFCVGDLVDRGPESVDAFEWLRKPWFHSVLGNHELAALDWVEGRLSADIYAWNGGVWNLTGAHEIACDRARIFSQLPIAIEIDTLAGLVALVHAGIPHASWDEFKHELRCDAHRRHDNRPTLSAALNGRDRIRRGSRGPVQGLRAAIVGHSLLDKPLWVDNVMHIDTGGWDEGYFTIVDTHTLCPARIPKKCGPTRPRASVDAAVVTASSESEAKPEPKPVLPHRPVEAV